ncbi:PepSY domain-containing protein [Komagataeibacter sp. AV436]|uniref:PepSY domain-containing protein n=2 Tax=Komagataeibacter melomenusus TaxID=2766578 RepID=A0ABX2AAM7_9PROT|nr:PepSY-associated TM helix domain-containing protein [Komagataeibacter melomenusus]NPC65411.1 PepSY domain-containing protein [Komagataeibacter melomenusus]
MRETLRTRLGWLHGWLGYMAGLVLTCIFATGSVAAFNMEITRWMQPEVQLATLVPPSARALDAAARVVAAEQARGVSAFIALPSARSSTLDVLHYNGHEFIGARLDPATGAVIPARVTAGGGLFYNFHHTLFLGPQMGTVIVNIAGIALLVAIISGVVIHIHALLPDIILLRLTAARLRAWLDAHLLAGVLFLPFMAMMAYTGVLVKADMIVPAPPRPARSVLVPAPPPALMPDMTALPLASMLARARASLPGQEPGFILFAPQRVSIFAGDASSAFLTRGHADFSLPGGSPLPVDTTATPMARTMQFMHGVHYARFAPPSLRWLYFLSGLCGTAVMASGLVLFVMKRRRHAGHRGAHRLADGLNVAVIAGLPAAMLAFLEGNRLVPASLAGREDWESAIFFAAWGLCTLHALFQALRGQAQWAWRAQLGLVGLLGTGLPVLDLLCCPGALRAQPGLHMAVDGMGAGAAIVALYARHRLGQRGA